MNELKRFDPDVQKIEDTIIEYLMNTSLATSRDEFTAKILFYFLTRRDLTQRMLKELTGFSGGKISQVVNDLVKIGLVDITKRSSSGEITYSMESIQSENFRRGNNLIRTSISWEDKLKAIKRELKRDKDELQGLIGYDKIKAIINQELALIARRKGFLEIWDKLRQKYEANFKK